MARGFQRLGQIVALEIHGHEADFAGLSRERGDPLELLLLRVGVIDLEHE